MRAVSDFPHGRMIENKYDPIKRSEETAKVVLRNDLRKYHRFRPARFYGGIATADCVGCCLRCIFFSPLENVEALRRRLGKIDRDFEDIEIEELVLYGDVENRLKKARIACSKAFHPDEIPPEQV